MKLIKIKKIMAGVLVAAAFLTAGCGQVKVGYVDVARVVDESPQLKTTVEEANKKLAEAQQEAEKAISEKGDNMSDEELSNTFQEQQKKLMGINQLYMTQIKQKMDVAMGQVAKEKQLDAVLESNKEQQSVYLGGIDVTDDVIAKLQ